VAYRSVNFSDPQNVEMVEISLYHIEIKFFLNIARITAGKNRDQETLNENDYS
jgi:hypothetical protein